MDVKSIYTKDFSSVRELEQIFDCDFTSWRSNGITKEEFLPMYVTNEKTFVENTVYYFNLSEGYVCYSDLSKKADRGISYGTKIRFIPSKRNIESIYAQNF